MDATPEIRDYIYLDWERIRSLAGQLFVNSPEALAGPGGADLRYFRSGEETPSLHQRVFSLMESELMRTGRATVIDREFDFEQAWNLETFRDGHFVQTSGALRLLDFEATSRFLDATPELMKAAFHMANLPKQEKAAKDFAARKELEQERVSQQKQVNEVKALKSDLFSSSIKELYGDLIRVKIRPHDEFPAALFVGTCDRNHFQEKPASLMEKYGFQVDAGWKVLGQVNVIPGPADTGSMPTGNSVLDTFESMALHFNSLMRLASAPVFPAVSFTPLCIYRTC